VTGHFSMARWRESSCAAPGQPRRRRSPG
jgi:hypothetical protein